MRSLFVALGAIGGGVWVALVACTGEDPVQCVGPQCSPAADGGGDATTQGTFVLSVPTRPIVVQGSSASVDVTVTRTGFNGPITIAIDGLPPNVSASPATIAPDAAKISVTLSATAAAAQGETTITIAGSDATGGVKNGASTSLLVRGPAGSLDTTFGQGGRATAPGGGSGFSVTGAAVQADGKVVVAGTIDKDFVAVRFDAKGAIDKDFGISGRATTDFRIDGGVTDDNATGVAIAPDGAIVVSGFTVQPSSKYAIARFLPNGKLDTGFDVDGYTFVEYAPEPALNGDLLAFGVAMQPDGKPVIAGTILKNGYDKLVLARFTTQGALDQTFTATGFSTHEVSAASNDTCQAVAIDPQGAVLCAGESNNRFVTLRVLANGLPDGNFGANGVAVSDFLGAVGTGAIAVTVLPDRTVLASGPVVLNAQGDAKIGVARITPAGLPAPGFGANGKTTFDFGSPKLMFGGAVLDGSGRLLVAAMTGPDKDMAIGAVKSDGTLDPTFAGAGKIVTNVPNGADRGPRIALGPDGRIFVATSLTPSGEVVVFRYWN